MYDSVYITIEEYTLRQSTSWTTTHKGTPVPWQSSWEMTVLLIFGLLFRSIKSKLEELEGMKWGYIHTYIRMCIQAQTHIGETNNFSQGIMGFSQAVMSQWLAMKVMFARVRIMTKYTFSYPLSVCHALQPRQTGKYHYSEEVGCQFSWTFRGSQLLEATAKLINNSSGKPILRSLTDKVYRSAHVPTQLCIPGLHISLGILNRLF